MEKVDVFEMIRFLRLVCDSQNRILVNLVDRDAELHAFKVQEEAYKAQVHLQWFYEIYFKE